MSHRNPPSKVRVKKVQEKNYIFLHEKHRKNARKWTVILAPIEITITVPTNIQYPLPTQPKGKKK